MDCPLRSYLTKPADRSTQGDSLGFYIGKRLNMLAKTLLQADGVCEGAELCNRLPARLIPQFSRAYPSKRCNYGIRGGQPYHKPRGWARLAVDTPKSDIKDWTGGRVAAAK